MSSDPQRPRAGRDGKKGHSDLQHVVAGDSPWVPLVPAGGVFEGQIAIQGETRIEGSVRGALRGSGRLELGPRGRIDGSIECDEVSSQGAIVGPVVAHRRVELGPGAVLEGDLEAPRVEVSESAVWNGVARVGQEAR